MFVLIEAVPKDPLHERRASLDGRAKGEEIGGLRRGFGRERC